MFITHRKLNEFLNIINEFYLYYKKYYFIKYFYKIISIIINSFFYWFFEKNIYIFDNIKLGFNDTKSYFLNYTFIRKNNNFILFNNNQIINIDL